MTDAEFEKYTVEHNLVVISREFFQELIDDHLKIQKLKRMTENYGSVRRDVNEATREF